MAEPPKPINWEDDFFRQHGVTDDKEKDAIRGRARVLAYDRAKRKVEEIESKPQEKKWFSEG